MANGNLNWEWFDPPEDSAPVQFFQKSSLHGLQYLGERKRHVCERLFWFTAFIAAMVTATVLIWHMWDGYVTMPIVTVFNPTEKTLDQIPFPAVTICSVNNIKKSKWEQYERDAMRGLRGEFSNETTLRKLANVLDLYHVCYSAKSFTQRFYNPDLPTGELIDALYNRRFEYDHFLDAPGTIRNASQTCSEMILFCLWLDSVTNCSDLFTQIETDYGYCCTFNMIPISLLRKFVNTSNDDPKRVKDWKEADLNYENLLFDDNTKGRRYPYRQLYAGRSAGLSILLDPNMEEYHCTNTDYYSEGFVVGINVPLDFPRMKDNGVAIRTSTEAFISVHPEITISDQSARSSKQGQRHCYFEGEKKLNHYTKYTSSNCLDECIAKKTYQKCGCIRYYMPRYNEMFCTPNAYNCTDTVKEKMIRNGLDKECNNCWPTCSEITYHTEVTSLRTREQQVQLLMDYHPNLNITGERAKNISIVHVFFGVDSIFPRLRKEMSTTIDLISNAGGLLGLCMGFSMLSLLEIVYHLSIRLFCNAYRERCEEPVGTKINDGFLVKIFNRSFPTIRKDKSEQFSSDAAIFKVKGVNGQAALLPVYFRTSFDADFQRARISTSWLSQQPHLISDAENNI